MRTTMFVPWTSVRAAVAACLLGLAALASAADPQPGIPGKDVVWIPTPQALVDRMLDMARLVPGDELIDLGSGDGRTVITAARRGARATGIEYNPELVEFARRNAVVAGTGDRARFEKADIFEYDFSRATVVTLFLLPSLNLKLRPRLLALKPGTRIVSNSFTMGEWQEDEKQTVPRDAGCDSGWCTAYLWIVPARFDGTYRTPQGEFVLGQAFQMLSGTMTTQAGSAEVSGRVHGEEALFTAGGRTFRVRRSGDRLDFLP